MIIFKKKMSMDTDLCFDQLWAVLILYCRKTKYRISNTLNIYSEINAIKWIFHWNLIQWSWWSIFFFWFLIKMRAQNVIKCNELTLSRYHRFSFMAFGVSEKIAFIWINMKYLPRGSLWSKHSVIKAKLRMENWIENGPK